MSWDKNRKQFKKMPHNFKNKMINYKKNCPFSKFNIK